MRDRRVLFSCLPAYDRLCLLLTCLCGLFSGLPVCFSVFDHKLFDSATCCHIGLLDFSYLWILTSDYSLCEELCVFGITMEDYCENVGHFQSCWREVYLWVCAAFGPGAWTWTPRNLKELKGWNAGECWFLAGDPWYRTNPLPALNKIYLWVTL